jgi:hypothetical protein
MRRMTRARRAVSWRFRWVAVAYLLLVLGVALFVYLATWGWLLDPAGGASFAGIWLFLVALPASLIPFVLASSVTGVPAFVLDVAVGLGQAALLFLLCWWLDRRRAS